MSVYQEAIEIFNNDFGEIVEKIRLTEEDLQGLPDFLREFLIMTGSGRRQDGFLWILNPNRYKWINELFNIKNKYVFARDSFHDVYMVDDNGACYAFSASYKQTQQLSVDFVTTLLNISDNEVTDGSIIYNRHKELWNQGNIIDETQCFCFSPAIPLGGDEEASDIYVGDMKTYFNLLAQM